MTKTHKLTAQITPTLKFYVEGEYYAGRPATMEEPQEYPEFEIKYIDIAEGTMLDFIEWFECKYLLDISDICIDEIQKQQS